MTYSDFYDIAEYGSKNWKGSFTPKEIAEQAYNYYSEFLWSIKNDTVSDTIKSLCRNLADDLKAMSGLEEPNRYWLNQIAEGLCYIDMDWQDYIETDEWINVNNRKG